MTTENKKKCAHPALHLPPSLIGQHLLQRPVCAAMEESPEIDCRCTHSACKGKAH